MGDLIFTRRFSLETKFSATGGTVLTNGGYTIHSFTNVGTSQFVVQSLGSNVTELEYLIVGGGGAGGARHAGGGAGGGVLIGKIQATIGNFNVVVGNGGPGLFFDGWGTPGQNSLVFGLTAFGGGTGGSWNDPGNQRAGTAGGSGGGSSYFGSIAGGFGTIGQGFDGGMSQANSTGHGSGGGGAGGPGRRAFDHVGGHGGSGKISNILGTSYHFGGGGGGGAWQSTTSVVGRRGGNGGIGGGGGGGQAGTSSNGTPGTGGGLALNSGGNGLVGTSNASGGNGGTNTGGGGGGGGAHPPNTAWGATRGGNGGSGIVVIRYLTNDQTTLKDGLSAETAFEFTSEIPSNYNSGSYWIKDRNKNPRNVFINMTDNGGRWIYLTNNEVTRSWGSYSFNNSTYAHSMQATQVSQNSASHFGATTEFFNIPFDIKEVAVFHTGGCGYSCAGPTWNNQINISVGLIGQPLSQPFYPGWGISAFGPVGFISGQTLCDGWTVFDLTSQANHSIHLGLGGFSSCIRATHTNIVAIRNYA
jgi:hypothetical protein